MSDSSTALVQIQPPPPFNSRARPGLPAALRSAVETSWVQDIPMASSAYEEWWCQSPEDAAAKLTSRLRQILDRLALMVEADGLNLLSRSQISARCSGD
jgi:hypothetical protein